MHHGFVDAAHNRLVVVVDATFVTDGNGALFGVDMDSGARAVISGTSHDPRTGAMMVGTGPVPGHWYDVQPAPDRWVALVDTGTVGQLHLMYVDPATGNRTTPTRDLETSMWPACAYPEMPGRFFTQYVGGNGDAGPSLAVGDDGTVYLPFAVGGTCDNFDGILAISNDTCRVVSLSSVHGAGRCSFEVGQGPSFASPRTLRFHGGQLYSAQIDGSLMKIDPMTGRRETVASDRVGTGPRIADAGQFAFDARGGLWAILQDMFEIGTVDYASTGNRVATPARLSTPYPSLYPHPTRPVIYVADDTAEGGVIWIVDPATGNKNVFSF